MLFQRLQKKINFLILDSPNTHSSHGRACRVVNSSRIAAGCERDEDYKNVRVPRRRTTQTELHASSSITKTMSHSDSTADEQEEWATIAHALLCRLQRSNVASERTLPPGIRFEQVASSARQPAIHVPILIATSRDRPHCKTPMFSVLS